MAKKHIDRAALIAAIRELKELSNEQKSDILQLISEQKKYGLVWEESTEEAEEVLRTNIPVLKEVKDKAIVSLPTGEGQGEATPNHILIEGENLQALNALVYLLEGKVDVIYIDPPYNTGNKDFVYNDSFVDQEDGYRHSKWLSFMEKRLKIAKKLLSDKGVIFISIDDNEQANLKLLCDDIFLESNYMGNIIWQSRTSISNDDYISTNHNHTHIYARNIDSVFFDGEPIPMDDYSNPDNDPRGPWKLVPIDANHPGGDTVYGIVNPNTGVEYFPPNNRIWAYNREGMQRLIDDGRIKFGMNGNSSPKKKLFYNERVERGDTKTPSSILLDAKTTKDGTNELIDILGKKLFDYPKPSEFIRRLLMYCSKRQREAIILDFFAGSGTTMHATMQLNAEDGGHRQCILVTNNENNICEEVTYERNKRVINGYTTPKGVEVEGLHNNNLRYYKMDFVPRENTHNALREEAMAMTDLLCIKEGVYDEQNQFGNLSLDGKSKLVRFFANDNVKMLLIYDSRVVPFVVKEIAKMDGGQNIKVYIFADGSYPYTSDFEDVLSKVTLVPMPYAMNRALRNVLPAQNEMELEGEPENTEDND